VRFVRIIGKSLADFFGDGGLVLASSLSYFTMMALVPFCIFLLAVFGYFLGHHPAFYNFFLNKLVNLFPSVTHDVTKDILQLVSSRALRRISFILYGLLSYQVFASLEHSLNTIFKVKQKRHFFLSVLLSLAVITLMIILLLLSFVAASLLPFLKVIKPYVPVLRIGKLTAFAIAYIVPFVLVLFTVTSVYTLFPRAKVRLGNALRGALFTTILLEIAKHLFTWYVVSITDLGKIYGPLTAFVVFLLWMFYSSSIFLVGAEIVHNLGSGIQVRGKKR
jgi:membrane protein